MPKKKAPRRRGDRGPTQREVMQYIVDNSRRYNDDLLQERARQFLDRGYSYLGRSEQTTRVGMRSSAQRSAARRRAPVGMSSARTRDVVSRQTGLSRENVTDRDVLRARADNYAAYGWGR